MLNPPASVMECSLMFLHASAAKATIRLNSFLAGVWEKVSGEESSVLCKCKERSVRRLAVRCIGEERQKGGYQSYLLLAPSRDS